MRLAIFGLGYAAHAIARTQIASGWQIAATVRSAAKADTVAADRLDGAAVRRRPLRTPVFLTTSPTPTLC